MGNRFVSRSGRQAELNKWRSGLSEEIAEFLTKTERKKFKNAQNVLLDGYYLLLKEYLREKKISL